MGTHVGAAPIIGAAQRPSLSRWIGVVALMSLAAVGCSSGTAERRADDETRTVVEASAHADGFPTAAFAGISEDAVSKPAAAEFQAALTDAAGWGGMAATVMSAGGTWSGAAGKADTVRDVRLDTQFPIASVTKPIVAAQVMQLVEAGELRLGDLAADHLPPDLDFDANGATIRQLLTQRSGIPDYYPVVEGRLRADPRRVWTPADLLNLVPATRTPAGQAFEYTDTNYLLLGLVLEQVRGRPIHEVLRAGVLSIDGVERLIYQPGEFPTEPMAMPDGGSATMFEEGGGYLPSVAQATADRTGAGMASDTLSLARWWRALCAGEIVSRASLTEMSTFLGRAEYGLGLFVVADPYERASVGHTGSGDGYVSWAGCLLDDGAVVVVLTNQVFDDIGGMARPLVEAVQSG
jgi:D-alanyl-D-alanine carboxypeptidase